MLAHDLRFITQAQLWDWIQRGKCVWDLRLREWIIVAPLPVVLVLLPQQLGNRGALADLRYFTDPFKAVADCMSKDDGFLYKSIRAGTPGDAGTKLAAVEALPYDAMSAAMQTLVATVGPAGHHFKHPHYQR
jgi:hypothetical protein